MSNSRLGMGVMVVAMNPHAAVRASIQTRNTPDDTRPGKLSTFELDRLRVEAHVDRRTLRKALRGERVAPMCHERIRAALAARDLSHLLPD